MEIIEMKTAKETTEAVLNELRTNSTKSRGETLTRTGFPTAWVSALFIRFQARYGHKWTSAIDGIEEIAVLEWSETMSGVTGEQVKHGLETWKEAWPPSAPEFRDACVGKNVNEFGLDYVPEVYRKQPERRRERLLSSDDRDARRDRLSSRMGALKASLKKLCEKDPLTQENYKKRLDQRAAEYDEVRKDC